MQGNCLDQYLFLTNFINSNCQIGGKHLVNKCVGIVHTAALNPSEYEAVLAKVRILIQLQFNCIYGAVSVGHKVRSILSWTSGEGWDQTSSREGGSKPTDSFPPLEPSP